MQLKRNILFLAIIAMLATVAHAAPPQRVSTYTSGTTIRSSDVTSNEDAIFNYLQSGVDTVADGTITNADVNASAAIAASKLNLSSVAQNVGASGSWSFVTITDLGTVTTADINGGTIDDVVIGGTTPAAGAFTSVSATTTFTGSVGTTINEFSTDGTLAGDSDDALPTEKAVKTYVDRLLPTATVFSFAIGGDASANSYGIILNDFSSNPAASEIQKLAWAVSGTTIQNVIKSKFKKVAGVDSIKFYARIWSNGTGSAIVTVNVETIDSVSVMQSSNTTSPGWVTNSTLIDVSGASDGTVYDLSIGIKTDGVGSSTMAYMDSIIGFGE
jgi:hypothetical protein